jgi:hypothetical protein
MPVLDPHAPYTYRSYFEMRIDPIDLAQFFGYQLHRATLTLNTIDEPIPGLDALNEEIIDAIKRLVSMNEQAKREMIVAPVVRKVSRLADSLIRVEYPINISDQLKGNVDYLLSVENLSNLVILEAKQDDLDYGFTQLAAELIGLDHWERSPSVDQQPIFTGAVTIGTLWQFGKLNRTSKVIEQDINGYRLPQELEFIIRVLIKSLRS